MDGLVCQLGTALCLQNRGKQAVHLAEIAEEPHGVVSDHGIRMERPHPQRDVREDVHLPQPQILQTPIQSLTGQHGNV